MKEGTYCSLVYLDLTKIGQGVMALTDAGHDVVYQGISYRAFGTLLAIDKITTENTITSKELSVTLSGITMDFQESVNSNKFRRAPIRIFKAFIPAGSNIVTEASIYYRGYGSTPETDVNFKQGTMSLLLSCKSVFDLDRKPSLCRANNATHQAYHNGDAFFQYANQDLKDDAMWRR